MKLTVVSLVGLLLLGVTYAEEEKQDPLQEPEDKQDALTEVDYPDDPDDLADPYSEDSPDELQNHENEIDGDADLEKKDPWFKSTLMCRRRSPCNYLSKFQSYCRICLRGARLPGMFSRRRRSSRRRRRRRSSRRRRRRRRGW